MSVVRCASARLMSGTPCPLSLQGALEVKLKELPKAASG